MKRPLAVFCFSWFVVLLVLNELPQALPLAAVCFAAGTVIFGCFLFRNPKSATKLAALLCAAAGLLACARFAWYRTVLDRQLSWAEQTVSVKALVERVSWNDDSSRTDLKVFEIEDEVQNTPLDITVWGLEACEAGDVIDTTLALTDAGRYGREQGVALYGYAAGPLSFVGHQHSVQSFLVQLQQKSSSVLRALIGADAGRTAAAVCTGDKSALTDHLTRSYRLSGLSHLLAVSGMHLSVVCGTIMALVPKRCRHLGAVLGIAMVVLYASFTGMANSVLRAGCMFVLALLAKCVYADSDGATGLGTALFVITVVQPGAAGSASLSLSASATAGVLWAVWFWGEKVTSRLWSGEDAVPLWKEKLFDVGQMFFMSVSAQVAIIPASILVGTQLTIWSVLSGLFTIPLLPFELGCGLAGCLLWQVPFLRLPARVFLAICGVVARWQNQVAAWFAALPGGRAWLHGTYPLLCCAVVVAALVFFCRRRCFKTAVAAAVWLAGAGVLFGTLASAGTVQVALVGSTTRPSVVAMRGGEAVVLWSANGQSADYLENWLEAHGVEQITLFCDLSSAQSQTPVLKLYEPVTSCKPARDVLTGITFTPFDGIIITIEQQENGRIAYLDIGGIVFGTSAGRGKLADHSSFSAFLAGRVEPEGLLCETLFSNAANGEWAAGAEGAQCFVEGEDLLLSVRPGECWRRMEGEAP